MNLGKHIVSCADRAAEEYQVFSGNDSVNEMPEVLLTGLIARGLNEELGLHAFPERRYRAAAVALGRESNRQLTSQLGGYRADIALIDQGKLIGIVELKIFGENDPIDGLLHDRDRMRRLITSTDVKPYLAVMITDMSNGTKIEERRNKIEEGLKSRFSDEGPINKVLVSNDRNWRWQFFCGTFG